MRRSTWAALATTLAIAACSEPQRPATDSAVSAKLEAADATAKAELPPTDSTEAGTASHWSYDTQKDEMRGTTSYFARVSSENVLRLGFPYDADNARLTLRRRPSDGLSVMLSAPGQFLCNSWDDDTVAVKFDDGPIQHFTCAEPEDATTGLLFINSEARFIERLKKAKRLIIEAQMFQAGPQQMTFNVEGLAWPPKSGADD